MNVEIGSPSRPSISSCDSNSAETRADHALETRHYWLLEVAIDCVVWVLFAHYLLKIRARIRERDQIPGEDGLTEACCAYCCTGCVLCGTMGHELKLVGELYAPTENATRAGRSICCC